MISSPWSHDSGRRFVFSYHLSDDTCAVHERPDPAHAAAANSGKFLSRRRLRKPEPKVNGEVDFYTLEDFYIGESYI